MEVSNNATSFVDFLTSSVLIKLGLTNIAYQNIFLWKISILFKSSFLHLASSASKTSMKIWSKLCFVIHRTWRTWRTWRDAWRFFLNPSFPLLMTSFSVICGRVQFKPRCDIFLPSSLLTHFPRSNFIKGEIVFGGPTLIFWSFSMKDHFLRWFCFHSSWMNLISGYQRENRLFRWPLLWWLNFELTSWSSILWLLGHLMHDSHPVVLNRFRFSDGQNGCRLGRDRKWAFRSCLIILWH